MRSIRYVFVLFKVNIGVRIVSHSGTIPAGRVTFDPFGKEPLEVT